METMWLERDVGSKLDYSIFIFVEGWGGGVIVNNSEIDSEILL